MKICNEPLFNRQLREWIRNDRKVALKIMELMIDIERDPFEGIGKPEALKHDFSGYWSRRITLEHRLIYKIIDDSIYLISCVGHYG